MKQGSVRMTALVALIGLVLVLQACQFTTQRVVEQGFQAQDDKVIFLYEESPSFDRGILECSVADDGDLYDCRDMAIVFNEED